MFRIDCTETRTKRILFRLHVGVGRRTSRMRDGVSYARGEWLGNQRRYQSDGSPGYSHGIREPACRRRGADNDAKSRRLEPK